MPVRPLRQKPKARTLKVRARLGHQWMVDADGVSHPGPRVPDIERHADGARHGVRAYVGYVFDRNLAEEGSEGGFRPILESTEVPERSEYIQALVHGDLWPADEATAKAVSVYATNQGVTVKFDPTYGGELAELSDWLKECDAALLEKKDAVIDATVNRKTSERPSAAPTLVAHAEIHDAPDPATTNEGKA